jgi:hypothetical protein
MTRNAPLNLCAAAFLTLATALPGNGADAANASQGLVGCIDELPSDVELDLALTGRVNTHGEGPRFRGELTIEDGRDDDAPPPRYVEALITCMKNVVHGEHPEPAERLPNSVLIF